MLTFWDLPLRFSHVAFMGREDLLMVDQTPLC